MDRNAYEGHGQANEVNQMSGKGILTHAFTDIVNRAKVYTRRYRLSSKSWWPFYLGRVLSVRTSLLLLEQKHDVHYAQQEHEHRDNC